MDNTIYLLDLFGTGVFAVTGALAAGRKRMDVFGVIVLACVTALGGGTVRDVILGVRPVFWIENVLYLTISFLVGLLAFITARFFEVPYKGLVYADALGLAVFTVVGTQKALLYQDSMLIAVIMGVTTAVVGGIVRDILSGEIPMILRQEIYATAALFGAITFIISANFTNIRNLPAVLAILVTLTIRVCALKWNLSLPVFTRQDGS